MERPSSARGADRRASVLRLYGVGSPLSVRVQLQGRAVTMDTFFTSSSLLALITLTFLEIVLGVDNVIFISVLSSKLPESRQGHARRMGLLAAMGTRILLLFSVVWIIRLTAPLFYILGRPISGRDLILVGGGLFLLAKATIEIHERLEGEEGHSSARVRPSFAAVILQILV